MESVISKPAFVACIAVALLFCATRDVLAQSSASSKLNKDASEFAGQLIKDGHVIADGKGAWSAHRPPANEEDEFILLHGFGEYAKWHLGIDERYPANTKRRYKFTYGDFKKCTPLRAFRRTKQSRPIQIFWHRRCSNATNRND